MAIDIYINLWVQISVYIYMTLINKHIYICEMYIGKYTNTNTVGISAIQNT